MLTIKDLHNAWKSNTAAVIDNPADSWGRYTEIACYEYNDITKLQYHHCPDYNDIEEKGFNENMSNEIAVLLGLMGVTFECIRDIDRRMTTVIFRRGGVFYAHDYINVVNDISISDALGDALSRCESFVVGDPKREDYETEYQFKKEYREYCLLYAVFTPGEMLDLLALVQSE
ncbi:hypothetical protein JT350_gp09 [Salmonella phage SAP012]|uniref:Uncharacterized protein n=1 Tax=Salmonella phage SAP012 TaxID=2742114 RepID=A0A6J4EFD1_9CAUD|nr:hypothetical protein JT350_gp09 [Salmonella phage SAP012]BCG45172.1 hypothetical protein [Salmonella phage SAP012]